MMTMTVNDLRAGWLAVMILGVLSSGLRADDKPIRSANSRLVSRPSC